MTSSEVGVGVGLISSLINSWHLCLFVCLLLKLNYLFAFSYFIILFEIMSPTVRFICCCCLYPQSQFWNNTCVINVYKTENKQCWAYWAIYTVCVVRDASDWSVQSASWSSYTNCMDLFPRSIGVSRSILIAYHLLCCYSDWDMLIMTPKGVKYRIIVAGRVIGFSSISTWWRIVILDIINFSVNVIVRMIELTERDK